MCFRQFLYPQNLSAGLGISHRAVMDAVNTKNGKDLPKSEKSEGSGDGTFYMK
jgi:hypothetical protein